jgi:hypothetical protein
MGSLSPSLIFRFACQQTLVKKLENKRQPELMPTLARAETPGSYASS